MQRNVLICICPFKFKRSSGRKLSSIVVLALLLQVLQLQRTRAEGQVAYRYEYYKEKDDRIEVQTSAALFDVTLKEGLVALKGEVVHDALSGATPSGAAPPNQYNYDFGFPIPILGDTNSSSVPLQHMQDVRNSIALQLPVTLGLNEITPSAAYSDESDYKSTGGALNYALLLNEKNTTLNVGLAGTWDRVLDTTGKWHDKTSFDVLIGVNQLLGPKTVLGATFTYGQAYGYLNDPYRFIVGTDPQLDADNPAGTPEERPPFKQKFVTRVSLTQFITPANASVEAAYRFYDDSFGITAQTVELAWYQNIGKHVVLSPSFRYYYQTQADFYYEILPGSIYDPPPYYSPDYRLSEMQTFAVGLNLMVKVTDWLMLDASYKYYAMQGLDGVTSQTAYPDANVFTVGGRINF